MKKYERVAFRYIIISVLWFMMCSNDIYSIIYAGHESYITVQKVIVSGNTVTKARIILNELVFSEGDKIHIEEIDRAATRSKYNLLNTSLFNYVTIVPDIQSDNTVVFYITVDERWYWWIVPVFEVADRNLSAFLNSNDWSRVNYGIYIKRNNFRGRNEKLSFRLRLGYTTQLYMAYNSPEYRRKSGWGFSFDFRAFHHLSYQTIDNQPVYTGIDNQTAQSKYFASLFYTLRSGLYNKHVLQLSYNRFDVNDSIIHLNPDYLTHDKSELQYLELQYEFDLDKRDSKVYPLKGGRFKFNAIKSGFGIWDDKLDNVMLNAIYDRHNHLGGRWHLAGSLSAMYNTSTSLPYIMNAGLGYRNFINGYELYVIDGASNMMMKNQFLFTLLKPRTKNINFMNISQFAKLNYALYLKTFYDFGYVWQDNPPISNTFVNNWQYGYGVGVDFVTFYDLVWSFNYSMNKLEDHGFFVHLNLTM